MAKEAEFTDQIVVMNTMEQGTEIRVLAELWGVSVAEVSREAQGYGLGKINGHYTNAGRRPKMSRDEALRRVNERRARAGTLSPATVAEVEEALAPAKRKRAAKIPAAVFSPAR